MRGTWNRGGKRKVEDRGRGVSRREIERERELLEVRGMEGRREG